MLQRVTGLLLLLSLLLLGGCNDRQRLHIQVNNINAEVELALTYDQRSRGLMGRQALERDQGMLFVFPDPAPQKFWMLNTLIPLDVGFFDAGGVLLNVQQMQPDGGKRIYPSEGPALYALEMRLGWFERHGLRPGARLKLPQPLNGK